MHNTLEIDKSSELLLDLGIDTEKMYQIANNATNLPLADKLKVERLDYYKELKEKDEPFKVRFPGFRKHGRNAYELFALFGDVELVYPIGFLLEGEKLAAEYMEQEYTLHVSQIYEESKRVVLADRRRMAKKQAIELINEKLKAGEEIYLRGNLLTVQRNSGKHESRTAAYVNIGGLGIIGIIPIAQWSVGFTPNMVFEDAVENNYNAIVNFRVRGITSVPYGKGTRTAYVCSRKDYLTKAGYDPWMIVSRLFRPRSTVCVKIIEAGKSDGCYFGAFEGIDDVNMLCYIDEQSELSESDIEKDGYYYGYIQRMEPDKKFLRVRLTKKANGKEAQQETEDTPVQE